MALDDVFNSHTLNGRANVGKATYAFVAAAYIWYRMTRKKPPKKPSDEQSASLESAESSSDRCGCPTKGSEGKSSENVTQNQSHFPMPQDISSILLDSKLDKSMEVHQQEALPEIDATTLGNFHEKSDLLKAQLEAQTDYMNKYRKDKLIKVEVLQPGSPRKSTIELESQESSRSSAIPSNIKNKAQNDSHDYIDYINFLQ